MFEDAIAIKEAETDMEFSMPEEMHYPEVPHSLGLEKNEEEKREKYEELEQLIRQELERQEQAEKEKKLESSFESGTATLSDTYKNLQELVRVDFQVLKTHDNRYFFQGKNGWEEDKTGNPAIMQTMERQGMFVHYDNNQKGGTVEIVKDIKETPEGTILNIESRSYTGDKVALTAESENSYEEIEEAVTPEPPIALEPRYESPLLPQVVDDKNLPLHEVAHEQAIAMNSAEVGIEKYSAQEMQSVQPTSFEGFASPVITESLHSVGAIDRQMGFVKNEPMRISESLLPSSEETMNKNADIKTVEVKKEEHIQAGVDQKSELTQRSTHSENIVHEKAPTVSLVEKNEQDLVSLERYVPTEHSPSLPPQPEKGGPEKTPPLISPETYMASSSEQLIQAAKESMDTIGTVEVAAPAASESMKQWHEQPVLRLLETPLQEKVAQAIEQITQGQSAKEVAIYSASQERPLDGALIVRQEGERIHLTLLESEEPLDIQSKKETELSSVIIESAAAPTSEKTIAIEVAKPLTETIANESSPVLRGALSAEKEPASERNSRFVKRAQGAESILVREEENTPTPVTPISLSFIPPSTSPSSSRSSGSTRASQRAITNQAV